MPTVKGRIIGIDYGMKRIGLSATDSLQIIVSGLSTVDRKDFQAFITNYIKDENVVKVVFGKPEHADGTPTKLWIEIQKEVKQLNKTLPELEIDYIDESFTSADARSIIFQSGIKKMKRRDKKLVDKVSAVLILQRYLGHI